MLRAVVIEPGPRCGISGVLPQGLCLGDRRVHRMKEIEKRLDVNSQDSILTPETRYKVLKVNVETKEPRRSGGVGTGTM